MNKLTHAHDHLARRAGRRRKILVVDDNKLAADSLGKLLEHLGHEVRIVYDGIEALEYAQTYPTNTVLLDIGMPHLDGYAVAKQLRKSFSASKRLLQLIAVSGYGQDEDQKRAFAAGFDYHFVKPLDVRELEKFFAEHEIE